MKVWKLLSRVQLFATPWTYTVHEILQARILEYTGALLFSRRSSQPRNQTGVWVIREALLDIYFLQPCSKSWDGLGIYILKGLVLKSLIKPQLRTNWWLICQVMCKVFTKVKDLEIAYDLPGHQAGKILPCLTLRCPKAGPEIRIPMQVTDSGEERNTGRGRRGDSGKEDSQ